jgi:hypothetical protein
MTRRRQRRARPRRQGVITLEFVLVLPILIVLVLAVVQFGVFHARMQQVALACRVGAEEASQTSGLCRVGAEEASQTSGLSTTDGDPVPPNVRDAIDHQLRSSGIDRCRIRLEHDVTPGSTVVVLSSPAAGACVCGPNSLAQAPYPAAPYVRLTVCVPMTELAPNCLRVIGYNIDDPSKVAECTTVFRYEL